MLYAVASRRQANFSLCQGVFNSSAMARRAGVQIEALEMRLSRPARRHGLCVARVAEPPSILNECPTILPSLTVLRPLSSSVNPKAIGSSVLRSSTWIRIVLPPHQRRWPTLIRLA
jgi:hypothetical protein